MLTEISDLILGQPVTYRSLADEETDAESLDGCDDEVGKPSLVVSPANIPAYDRCRRKGNGTTHVEGDKVPIECDEVLLEWFAGWAAINAQRHRKFPAISGMASFISVKSVQWGHVRRSFSFQRGDVVLTMRRLRSWILTST